MGTILNDLVDRIEDEALRAQIAEQVATLEEQKDYGLVFSRHTPETVRLPNHPVRRRTAVTRRDGSSDEVWAVKRVRSGMATVVNREDEAQQVPVSDLVAVQRFGDPIYPGLVSRGKVECGGDKPFSLAINGENYHALATLLYPFEGKVDTIYIDPPYNTGAKDWKYNNDYVDGNDSYRHSKWLSFMEKRLLLAKRLLNPRNSALIVTIDEKEYLRLGMLLEQVFPESGMQMVSSVIAPQGNTRKNFFKRSNEYIYIVLLGSAAVAPLPLGPEWDGAGTTTVRGSIHWASLKRTGTGAMRVNRPRMFYPVFMNGDGTLHSVGEAPPDDADRDTVAAPDGTSAIWPIRTDGTEGRWQVGPATLRTLFTKGYVKFGKLKGSDTAISYLKKGEQTKVESGEYTVTGHRIDGSVITAEDDDSHEAAHVPTTVWNLGSHSAGNHGSTPLKNLLPRRSFPFPKSLYAVEDVLRFFVVDKQDALILDFFAGSGTTAHAVARLNRQDGGRRQSISISNNEVSTDEANQLRAAGHLPGDAEWEALGIFSYITEPRIRAAITGRTPDDQPVKGDYKFTDEFPMSEGLAENVEFFNLAYLDRNEVERGKAFQAIAPLLWLEAGATGERIDAESPDFAVSHSAGYAILFDVGAWSKLSGELDRCDDINLLFVITDSLAQYQQIVAEVPPELTTRMLYEDYLDNFEINTGGAQ